MTTELVVAAALGLLCSSGSVRAQPIDTHNCYRLTSACRIQSHLPMNCIAVGAFTSLPKVKFNRVRHNEDGMTGGTPCGISIIPPLQPCGYLIGRHLCVHTDCPPDLLGDPLLKPELGVSSQAPLVEPTVWSLEGDTSGVPAAVLPRLWGPTMSKMRSIRLNAVVRVSSSDQRMSGRGRYKLWLEGDRYRVSAKTDLDGLLIGDLEASFSDRGYRVQHGFIAIRSSTDRRDFPSPIPHYLHLLVQPLEDQIPCASMANQTLCSLEQLATALNSPDRAGAPAAPLDSPVEFVRYVGRTSKGRLKMAVQLDQFEEVSPGVRLPGRAVLMSYDRNSEGLGDFAHLMEMNVEEVSLNRAIDASEYWFEEDPDSDVLDLDQNPSTLIPSPSPPN